MADARDCRASRTHRNLFPEEEPCTDLGQPCREYMRTARRFVPLVR
jgi:hypothetical protein